MPLKQKSAKRSTRKKLENRLNAYDAGVWLWNETSRQIYNFEEVLKGGWYPGR